jgi:hypothetical protein
VVPPPGTNPPYHIGGGKGHLYWAEAPPGTNANPHLYRMVCTGSIPDTNKGYEPVQKVVFPVVIVAPEVLFGIHSLQHIVVYLK